MKTTADLVALPCQCLSRLGHLLMTAKHYGSNISNIFQFGTEAYYKDVEDPTTADG